MKLIQTSNLEIVNCCWSYVS